MALPSGDTITLNSGTSNIAGNKLFSVSMEFNDNNTAFDSDYDFKLLNVGSISFDIDVAEDTDDVTEFFYNVPSYEFEFSSSITSSIDFGEFLNQMTSNDLVKVTITYDGGTDIYIAQKSDFDYNFLDKKVTCTCYSPFKYADQVSTFDTSSRVFEITWADNNDGTGTEYTYDAITMRDLIEAYVESLGESVTSRTQSNFDLKLSDVEAMNDGESLDISSFVTTTNSLAAADSPEGADNTYVVDTYEKSRDKVLLAGLAEAAIVGTMFGEAFYVRRDYNGSDTDYFSEILASDIGDFSIGFEPREVSSLTIDISNTTVAFAGLGGSQRVSIDLPAYVDRATITLDAQLPPIYDIITKDTDTDGEYTYVQQATDAGNIYKLLFNVQDTIRISGTIFGTDKVKPYYYLEIDETISKYIDSSNNKIRPSKLTYNLSENKVEFEGYSI